MRSFQFKVTLLLRGEAATSAVKSLCERQSDTAQIPFFVFDVFLQPGRRSANAVRVKIQQSSLALDRTAEVPTVLTCCLINESPLWEVY